MPLSFKENKVAENIEISNGIYKLVVKGKYDVLPGQFFMLKGWNNEPFLPRPISVHNADDESVTFLYELKGEGTRQLSCLKPEDSISMLGPLGNGFDIDEIKGKVAVISGGIGTAPMLLLVKELKKRNINVDFHAGFRDKPYIIEEFKKYADKVFISTESGIEGHRGYVTDNFSPEKYDTVLCCGPEIMMKKVTNMCIEKDVQIYVSMEKKMACGIGACLGCTCKTKIGNKRTCKDGPVFDGRDVIYA